MVLVAVLLQVAGFLLAFLIAHKQALAHAVAQSPTIEIDLAAPPERLPGGLIVALLPPCSLIVLAVWVAFNWDRLQDHETLLDGVFFRVYARPVSDVTYRRTNFVGLRRRIGGRTAYELMEDYGTGAI